MKVVHCPAIGKTEWFFLASQQSTLLTSGGQDVLCLHQQAFGSVTGSAADTGGLSSKYVHRLSEDTFGLQGLPYQAATHSRCQSPSSPCCFAHAFDNPIPKIPMTSALDSVNLLEMLIPQRSTWLPFIHVLAICIVERHRRQEM